MSLLDRFFRHRRLNQLLDAYTGQVRLQLKRLAPQLRVADSDDLVQEVRIRLWQVLKSERNLEQPASYIRKVVLTTTIDALRRAKVRGDGETHLSWDELLLQSVPGQEADLGEQAGRWQQVQALESRLKDLEPDEARAMRLHLLGFTTEEIGKALDWTEAKARNFVYRTVKLLQIELDDDHA